MVLSADLGREGRGSKRSSVGGDELSVTKSTTRAVGMSCCAECPVASQGDVSIGEPQARRVLLDALEAALLPAYLLCSCYIHIMRYAVAGPA